MFKIKKYTIIYGQWVLFINCEMIRTDLQIVNTIHLFENVRISRTLDIDSILGHISSIQVAVAQSQFNRGIVYRYG